MGVARTVATMYLPVGILTVHGMMSKLGSDSGMGIVAIMRVNYYVPPVNCMRKSRRCDSR